MLPALAFIQGAFALHFRRKTAKIHNFSTVYGVYISIKRFPEGRQKKGQGAAQ
jgi:hypothetical protein